MGSPQEWNLSDLYQGFDDPRLAHDLAALEQVATEFRQMYRGKVSALTPETIATCLQALEAIAQKSGYLYAFPALVFSADTRNAEAKQMQDVEVDLENPATIHAALKYVEGLLDQLQATF